MNTGDVITKGTEVGTISARGVRTHNLKNIDLELPQNCLIVLTGVSGSGKSSLAFDTLFVEGRRRYIECLSPQLRQMVKEWPHADVDSIEGLPPVLSVSAGRGAIRRRQMVLHVADLDHPLRVLWGRGGEMHCPQCGGVAEHRSRSALTEAVRSLPERTKLLVLAPLVKKGTSDAKEYLRTAQQQGFVRIRWNNREVFEVAQFVPGVESDAPFSIDVVVDRLLVKPEISTRLEESLEAAFRTGNGRCIVSIEEEQGQWRDEFLSRTPACQNCDLVFPSLMPRLFSFSNPASICPKCQGTGLNQSLTPTSNCTECGGAQLSPMGRTVTFANWTYPNFLKLPVSEAIRQVSDWKRVLAADTVRAKLISQVVPRIEVRLQRLQELGLGYLSLDRPASTLSGGELQRVRLAAGLSSELTGVCYVLDEPTSGLHPVDTGRLLDSCRRLCEQGNSLLVIEHDLSVIQAADHVVELGPGAGPDGGNVLFSGSPASLQGKETPTGRALANRATSKTRPNTAPQNGGTLQIGPLSVNNLKDVHAEIPLQRLVCVTGVSGCGKSSLIMQGLAETVRKYLASKQLGTEVMPSLLAFIGKAKIDRLLVVDQSPLGRSARSTPATVTGVWSEIRKVLAKTKMARLRGFIPSQFSFVGRTGVCGACRGLGVASIRSRSLPEVEIPCQACHGRRFNASTLEVLYHGRTPADLLEMTIGDAAEFWENLPRIGRPLRIMAEIGLAHLSLGQSALTLSGGEAQRVKLAAELTKANPEQQTLYLLDEPSAGLHPEDLTRLETVFRNLVSAGQTVVIIEHNLQMIAASDWVIDLGPGSGNEGGRIVANGTPMAVARENTATASALREWLEPIEAT